MRADYNKILETVQKMEQGDKNGNNFDNRR